MAEGNHNPEHPEQAQNTEHPAAGENANAAASQATAAARKVAAETGLDREGPSLATAALVGVGAAIIEPELIPGLLIGAGAVLVPKLLPALGNMVRPLVKGVVKAGYSTTMRVREAAAELGEQVEDIVAEARAEGQGQHPAGNGAPQSSQTAAKRQRRSNRNPVPAANL